MEDRIGGETTSAYAQAYQLALFGFPDLSSSSGQSIKLGMRARALLAYLVVEGSLHSRSHLAGLLWPDRPIEQGRASLRQCLVELQRGFSLSNARSPLTIEGQLVGVAAGAVPTDLADLRHAAANRDVCTLGEALKGAGSRPLLDAIPIQGDFARWITAMRTALEAELDASLASIHDGVRAAPMDSPLHGHALTLAQIRLKRAPECRQALAIVSTLTSKPVPSRQPLPALPVPSEAPPAVIVEPFRSDDNQGAALIDAIREEVISALACFRELRVVVLSEVSDHATDVEQGGFRLSVMLRSVAGGRYAVARLTDARDGHAVWGVKSVLAHGDMQAGIEAIIEQIVGAVAPAVEANQLRSLAERPSGAIYSRYLLTKANSQAPRDFAAAEAVARELEAIVEQAPGFAPPFLALARMYNTDFAWTRAMSSTDAHLERALDLARRAAAIDPGNVHCATLLGWCHLRRHEWGAARRFFDQGLRLNPYHATRLMEAAYGILHLGDLETAETILRRCLAISATTDDGVNLDLGMLSLVRGDPLLAFDYLSMISQTNPWFRLATALAARQAGLAFEPYRADARRTIAQLWPGGVLPAYPQVRDWVVIRHPFRLKPQLDRYTDGLEDILG